MSQKDFSGQIKHVQIHDVESGAKKQVKANDQDAISKVVPATHNLKQNVNKRTAPRKEC